MLGAVSAAVEALTSRRMHDLLLIQGSKKYLNRLVDSLKRRGGQEGKLQRDLQELEKRRTEVSQPK